MRLSRLISDKLPDNIISYAYPHEAERDIEVSTELTGDSVTATVSDDGIPFKPFAVDTQGSALSISKHKVGGSAIHLVRLFVDDFSYHCRSDGNAFKLVKRLGESEQR